MSGPFRMRRASSCAADPGVLVPESAIDRTLLQLAGGGLTEHQTRQAMLWRARLRDGLPVNARYRGELVRVYPPEAPARPLSDVVDETIDALLRPPG